MIISPLPLDTVASAAKSNKEIRYVVLNINYHIPF